ncbi:bifunctional diguanylate cyclase/phosphodiesterase [Halieaceae bacterium IMCC8485]|uniref:Bifunctional diguanylate cyclase/phosphodiesterase n=1 Tax=Candidatus Seongchinamella marina TaxID=2518990 RepID=A0ABT3SQ68_9GAMM|nr:bifunctional diguanylate cyclase/phosphodiesterase [Candidatus Seongchinamella marina]MCX2972118.1 bifunctional diguanylate cyclase/phosphodiesterase [Candidatus Seongchinamella marina]
MDQHTVLIISENNADHTILSACLGRALPARFNLASSESMQRPIEALLDPMIDAVIMTYGPETEYLLRLAQKNQATVPLILLLDEENDQLASQLRELGAQDYLVRGQLQDALVHRVLDYSIQLKQARDTIQQLSNRDSLTGALNRAGFRAHMERAMERSERYDFNTALLYINMDQFANINDHYGETDGDLLIKTISRRLINKMRSTDSIARLGGDEFAIVLEDVSNSRDVELIAEKMIKSITAPMILSEQQVSIDASIGAAIYPDDGKQFSELVDFARSAMQQAKSVEGSKYIRYSEQLTFDQGGSNSLAAELRTAVRQNQFELHYQPRIDLTTGKLVGLEALLRWNHPERGLLCPSEFIVACEDMGLLRTIGYQVIQHACAAQVWVEEQGIRDVDVAVNISFSQFQDDRFVDIVKDIIKRSGTDASRLEFELTETTILKSPEAVKGRMDQLRLLGISFSLDDFGTGFSQLSHLTELPISALKIDACFVRDLPHNPHQEAVCAMIIEMARRLGMMVVAEGAETHEQVEYLREHKCQQVQGFYYSPAIPLQQLPRFAKQLQLQRREPLFS